MDTERDLHASPAIKTRSFVENWDATRCPTTKTLLIVALQKKMTRYTLIYIVHHWMALGKEIE